MTKSTKAKLAYQKKRDATPEQIHRRVLNNAARREAERKGLVHKGDGKEVDHKRPLDAGGTNADSNLRVVDASTNRAWRRTHGHLYGKNN